MTDPSRKNPIELSEDEGNWLIDPAMYNRRGYPWEVWKKLREQSGLHWVELESGEKFWAVTRHRDMIEIERNVAVFKNEPRLNMRRQEGVPMRMIVNMDPPDHGEHRAFAAPFFTPRAVASIRQTAEELIVEALDAVMAKNGEVVDLQEEVANLVPTGVISGFLGVARENWSELIRLTNQAINAGDPRLAATVEGGASVSAVAAREIFAVHGRTLAERRTRPRDDFMSALAQAQIGGEAMSETEQLSWTFILTTAGHETTQSTFTLGAQALMRHPKQFAKLRADLSLVPRAVDELLRYVSPAIHFARTASEDCEVGGRLIRKGDELALFYPSVNRDAEVFDRPDELDIERSASRHLAFGSGPHLCLGMHLAKLELSVMFEQFLKRLDSIEPAGEPVNVYSNNVGGFLNFPVRMNIRPAGSQ